MCNETRTCMAWSYVTEQEYYRHGSPSTVLRELALSDLKQPFQPSVPVMEVISL